MAFNHKNLTVESCGVASGDGTGTIMNEADFITADAPAVVEAAGYFNTAANRLPKCTIIEAVMTAAGTPVFKSYIVTANDGTAVTIAAQTA
jgi:UDP-N-acetyl-D-mannosaminuronic acid transferase (WecB/TagA/CpsF family)